MNDIHSGNRPDQNDRYESGGALAADRARLAELLAWLVVRAIRCSGGDGDVSDRDAGAVPDSKNLISQDSG